MLKKLLLTACLLLACSCVLTHEDEAKISAVVEENGHNVTKSSIEEKDIPVVKQVKVQTNIGYDDYCQALSSYQKVLKAYKDVPKRTSAFEEAMQASNLALTKDDVYKHSMANQRREAERRNREVTRRWYEQQARQREEQQRRSSGNDYYNYQRTIQGMRPAVNAPDFARQVLKLCNEECAKAGVAPLQLAEDLPMIRAEEISRLMSHTRHGGRDCTTVLKTKWGAGENIAGGHDSTDKVVAGWMDSPGHRRNILNRDFKYLGVGCYYAPDGVGGYKHYWVQIFQG